jgi:hypothetical protein
MHRLCNYCHSFHRWDPRDVPTKRRIKGLIEDRGVFCPNGGFSHQRTIPTNLPHGHHYKIAHRHVQMAMKLHGLEKYSRKYTAILGKLMEPIAVKYWLTVEIRTLYGGKLKHVVDAKRELMPMVVQGRYLLRRKLTLDSSLPSETSFLGVMNFLSLHMVMCPHVILDDELRRVLAQIDLTASTGSSLYASRVFSCSWCPTDAGFSYAYQSGRSEIRFTVWEDWGTGCSIADPFWFLHFSCPSGGVHPSSTLEYQHGSIRKMYEEAVA